ncbi:MAG: hypothetical protein JKX98_09155 [Alcanivoracaceae bacterium]|nr:hypothetical protein [Alcanivoracaceae bacterium]
MLVLLYGNGIFRCLSRILQNIFSEYFIETERSFATVLRVDISTFNIGENNMSQIDKANDKESNEI